MKTLNPLRMLEEWLKGYTVKTTVVGAVYFGVGFVGSLVVGWLIFPLLLYSSQEQPLNFNHFVHVIEDVGIDADTELEKCLYCHSFRDDGTFVGIPTMDNCFECHEDPDEPYGDTEDEQILLTEYVAEYKEIPWLVYSSQPDNVYTSHIAHVKMGEIECETCHGDWGANEQLPVYKENRITGYSIDIWGRNIAGYRFRPGDSMKMDDCADCHSERGQEKNNACFVCHK